MDRVGPSPDGVVDALDGDLYIINMTSRRVERMTLNERNVGVRVPMWTHGHVAAWEPALLGDDLTQFGTRTHFFMNGDAGELGHLWAGGGQWRFQQWAARSFGGDVREPGQVRLARTGRIAVATRRDANNRPDAVVFFENGSDQCVWQVTPALGETFASGNVRSPLRARSLTGLSGIPTGWAYTQNTDSCVVSLGQPAPRDGSTELILGLAEARAREPDRRFESRPVGDDVADAAPAAGPRLALDTFWRFQRNVALLVQTGGAHESVDPRAAGLLPLRVPVNERALYVPDRFARKQEAKKKTQVELLMDSPLWGQGTPRPRTFQEFRSMKRSSHVAPNKGSGCGC